MKESKKGNTHFCHRTKNSILKELAGRPLGVMTVLLLERQSGSSLSEKSPGEGLYNTCKVFKDLGIVH